MEMWDKMIYEKRKWDGSWRDDYYQVGHFKDAFRFPGCMETQFRRLKGTCKNVVFMT